MYYVAAKISVDKAENEHSTLQFYSFLFIFELLFYLVLTKYLVDVAELPDPAEQVEEPAALGVEGPGLQPGPDDRDDLSATRRPIGKISAKCCSFSAVLAPIFARKYAFFSIFF